MAEISGKDVIQARENEDRLNAFIEQNKRFILSSASKATGRFVSDSEDEFSIAMIAFHEAVQTFREEKGNFYSFALLVIRRRLIDYRNSQNRFSDELPIEPHVLGGQVGEEAPALHLQVRSRQAELSEQDTETRPEGNPIRDEIEAVQQLLSRYGFSFFDLTDCSPKAKKTKEACAKIVSYMLQREDLIEKMRSNCTLPAKEILEYTKFPRKILERHRKYIIAAVEILNGEYPLLAEYMAYIKKAMVT